MSALVFPSKAPLGFITAWNSSHSGFSAWSGSVCFIQSGASWALTLGSVAKANNSARPALASRVLMTDFPLKLRIDGYELTPLGNHAKALECPNLALHIDRLRVLRDELAAAFGVL